MFLFNKTQNLKATDVKNIINLKILFWNKYNLRDHHNWFIKNIRPNDLHFFFKVKNKIVIYCCLRSRKIFYKEKIIPFFYLDTLCSIKKYRGKIIIDFLKFIYMNKKKPIILLCKNEMISLYKLSLSCKIVKNFNFINHNIGKLNVLIAIPNNHKYKKISLEKKIKIAL